MVSDTHLRAGQADRLPVAVRAAAEQVEVILHAGDVTSVELLDELRSLAPLHAVLGNNDTDLTGVLPERVVVDLDGGGRMYVQMTDCTADEVKIGAPVELTYRRLHAGGENYNYFWKARPV